MAYEHLMSMRCNTAKALHSLFLLIITQKTSTLKFIYKREAFVRRNIYIAIIIAIQGWCSTNNEEFHFSYSTRSSVVCEPKYIQTHITIHIFPATLHISEMMSRLWNRTQFSRFFLLFYLWVYLWENEFSTTFFIFHIIYQKQINININAEVVGKEEEKKRTQNRGKFMWKFKLPTEPCIFVYIIGVWYLR